MKTDNGLTLLIYFKRSKKPIFSISCPDTKLYNNIVEQVKAKNEWINATYLFFKLEDFDYCILN